MLKRINKKSAALLLMGILALYLQNCEIQFGKADDQSDAGPDVKVLVVDVSNLDDLTDAMEEAQFDDQVKQNLSVMETGIDNSLSTDQESYLETVVDTLSNDSLSVGFWQNSVQVKDNKLVFSAEIEEILQIAEEQWLSLPYQAGLPVISSLSGADGGLGKMNTAQAELAASPFCFALTYNLELLLEHLESLAVCPDPDFESCVENIKSALVTTTDEICTALSRYHELCLADESVVSPEVCDLIIAVSVIYSAQQLWTITTRNLVACQVLCEPDCDDGNPCTEDYWDFETNECVHERIPGCHDQGGGL